MCDEVTIFSEHLRLLKSLVEKMQHLAYSDENIENIRQSLKKSINLIEKNRRNKSYKRSSKSYKNSLYD